MNKYRCPRHGDQGNVIGVGMRMLSQEGHPLLEAKFCMVCWFEHLQKDCEKLIEVDDEGQDILS